MSEEIEILRKIEVLLRTNQEKLLMDIVPADCKCQGKTKKVFRCPEAFEINMLLSSLNSIVKQ